MAGGLEGEPVLEAGAAEGVEAVEEGEGLVEELGAYLGWTTRSEELQGSHGAGTGRCWWL